MKVIIKIGFEEILLPDEFGVQTLLKLLGKALPVRDRLYQGKVEIEKGELDVQMKTVPSSTKFYQEGDSQTERDDPFQSRQLKRLNGAHRLLLNG